MRTKPYAKLIGRAFIALAISLVAPTKAHVESYFPDWIGKGDAVDKAYAAVVLPTVAYEACLFQPPDASAAIKHLVDLASRFKKSPNEIMPRTMELRASIRRMGRAEFCAMEERVNGPQKIARIADLETFILYPDFLHGKRLTLEGGWPRAAGDSLVVDFLGSDGSVFFAFSANAAPRGVIKKYSGRCGDFTYAINHAGECSVELAVSISDCKKVDPRIVKCTGTDPAFARWRNPSTSKKSWPQP